jgi:signal transduction histidine kinase
MGRALDTSSTTRAASRHRGPRGARVAALGREEPFAAYVAHELRTPLATQRVLLELALADPAADAAAWRELGEDMLDACLRQERVLEACLTLTRSQGRSPRFEPVDLATIVARALDAHDVDGLERVVQLDAAVAMGDPDLLERLVVNLVSNAVRHNIAGGRIEISTRAGARRVHLSVANSGPHVRPAELPRLFQPFQRGDGGASPPDGDGLGIGLAIVQAIADAHRALVEARARAEGGLVIEVAFAAFASGVERVA